MSAQILEIFHSIQGEGRYAGAAQVFVRFFECNMHCVWCDTPQSIGDSPKTTGKYKECSVQEVLEEIFRLWDHSHSVSLTGGEPLLQAEFIRELLPFLKKAGMPAYLDTNGTLPEELKKIIDGIDIIAMDLKLPSSTKERAFWKEHEEFLKIARQKEVFIKTVISTDTTREDIERAVNLVARVAGETLFILQPNYLEIKKSAVERCLEFQKYCSTRLKNVRILPQTHKILKVR